jgi:prolyl-tRNA synthetase
MLFVTLREDPAEAEIPSHKLLLRAGYIRRIAPGGFAYLPLMWRVLQKVSRIVREEMNAIGAMECLLPQLQPAELWQESGRWDTYTKAEGIMFSLVDRQEREMGLGPTHEEVITAIARDMVRSYRQLPLTLYQIQTKFRDEIRPRFGLMRGREFIMKDAYSFHTDEDSLKQTYQAMHQAYCNILRRCGLQFRAVDADSGAIGGSGSQEFMVLADAGEDEVLYTEDGNYSANVEKAISQPADAEPSPFTQYEKRETPGTDTIEKLCQFFQCPPSSVVKNVLYQALYDNGMTVLALVSIRGDQDVNEVKLQNELTRLAPQYGAKTMLKLVVPDEKMQEQWAAKPLPLGYLAPDLPDSYIRSMERPSQRDLRSFGLSEDFVSDLVKGLEFSKDKSGSRSYALADIKERVQAKLATPKTLSAIRVKLENILLTFDTQQIAPQFLRLVDRTAVDLSNFVTGANQTGYHVVGANWGTQFELPAAVVDLRKARVGDRATHDSTQLLQTARGIEIGHIFQLGTKYSKAMSATYTNEQGEENPLVMGCYGVGVSRLSQAAVEQSFDSDGIIWPVAIAPYQAIVVIPDINKPEQVEAGEKLYAELNQAGIETLLDDRNERAGVKFKDADLIGIPYRIVTGRAIVEGRVEVVKRATRESQEISVEQVVSTLSQWIAEASVA